ncbi:MAG: hypothetical protein FWF92_05250 [Oscillospiraceae bacterium]|nr:hypothetical protein [Oscillospiraceae bacterium]
MFDEAVHNIIKRKNKKFALCISILVFAFVAVRMVLARFYMHEEVHFYTDKANIFILSFDYIVAACVIAIYIISFFIYKRKKESHNYTEAVDCFVQGTQAQVFSASLTGFLFVANSVFQIYSFMNPVNSTGAIQINPSFIEHFFEYLSLYPLDFVIFFISILSSVYFFKTAALNFDIGENIALLSENNEIGLENEEEDNNYKYSSAHIIFSFMPIIWSFLNVFKCFFDMSKNVNSPVRIYELLSFLALSTYFVSESRMIVGRRETSRFFTFSYISLIIVAASSLPNLVWSSFWILTTNNDQIVYASQIAIVIYIFSRLYSQIKYGRFLLQR